MGTFETETILTQTVISNKHVDNFEYPISLKYSYAMMIFFFYLVLVLNKIVRLALFLQIK